MDEDYEQMLKYTALRKLKQVNHLIDEITIGPHSLKYLNINRSTPTKVAQKENKIKKDLSSPDTKNQVPTRQLLQIIELERQEKVQNILSERVKIFESFNKTQKEHGKQSWLRTQQAFIQDMERQEANIIQANQQYDLKNSTQNAKMAQQTQDAVLRMKQKQEQLRENERQRKRLSDNIEKIRKSQQQFGSEYGQILGSLKNCLDNDELRTSIGSELGLLKSLPTEMDELIEKCKSESVSDKEVSKSIEILGKIVAFKNKFKETVDKINMNKLEAKQAMQESSKPQPATISLQILPATVSQTPSETTDSNSLPATNTRINKFVSLTNLQTYTDLLEFLDNYRRSFQHLENDAAFKNFKFDCKKAINIPVNSLSGVNSEHIMDKYRKLHSLLSGQSIIIANKEINASKHPQGIVFCTDLLAKKFVLQGDLMVSSNPESAFCYASVILSLWNDYPDFGKLVLAYFFKFCPYLVPYYIPRQVGDTDEEFYMKLGYQYTDGEVEKQDKFLKRMTGIMKLYFAILIAKPKRGQNTSPYNLKYAWKWLASFLKLEPQVDITATALHAFLETVGFEMQARYGKVFQNVLEMIKESFLQKCKEARCTGGAIARLELLLSTNFEVPNGYIEYPYW